MSITPMWRVDRDGSMFTDKKAAEEYDRMLELAANISSLLEDRFEIDEDLAEEIGLMFAKNKEAFAKAFKGKPDLVLEIGQTSEQDNDTKDKDEDEAAA
ncbi:YebG family protein [Endozoicomonas sp. SESOKO4]|uniref:YebG family protein n=1 Tax=Endozoicomonas sp. SESOKO4 TaxID=2828745 RepID=UPI002147D9EE|nr:YebG family protein [Endozoicomonas sp. SESOKO4]